MNPAPQCVQPPGDLRYHRAQALPALPARVLIKPRLIPSIPVPYSRRDGGDLLGISRGFPPSLGPLSRENFPDLGDFTDNIVAITFDGCGTVVHCTESRSFILSVCAALSLQSIKYCTILWGPPTHPPSLPPTHPPQFLPLRTYTAMFDHISTNSQNAGQETL